jgi:hypothetical protein
MYRFRARITLTDGSIQEVFVDADNFVEAKALIELKYGKGCIVTGPLRVLN